MNRTLKALWEGYAVVAAAAGIVIVGALVFLYVSGMLAEERLTAAAKALQEPPPPTARVESKRVGSQWREFEIARKQVKKDQDRREQELQQMLRITEDEVNRIQARRSELEKKIKEYKAAEAAALAAKKALDDAKSDAELKSNVPILEKMDGAAILALMQGWDNTELVRYLRAMRASKAAEVLEAMRTDPLFEDGFRKPPDGAPRDAKTRIDLVMEEFRKVPNAEPE